jgi:hypothetical protein
MRETGENYFVEEKKQIIPASGIKDEDISEECKSGDYINVLLMTGRRYDGEFHGCCLDCLPFIPEKITITLNIIYYLKRTRIEKKN